MLSDMQATGDTATARYRTNSSSCEKLTLLSNWFIVNMLSLSIYKTCYSVFGATDVDKTNINLKIGDITLKQEECSKYLGVIIDSNLTWQNHIDYIYNKIIKFVGTFYRIRHKLNFEMAKMVYFAFVRSHLIYSIEIYGNTHKNHLSKLMVD